MNFFTAKNETRAAGGDGPGKSATDQRTEPRPRAQQPTQGDPSGTSLAKYQAGVNFEVQFHHCHGRPEPHPAGCHTCGINTEDYLIQCRYCGRYDDLDSVLSAEGPGKACIPQGRHDVPGASPGARSTPHPVRGLIEMADVEENTMLQGMGVTGSLARNKVPFAVVSLGVVTVLLAMFLPELTHGTVERGYETVTNFRHYLLLCTLAAVVGMLRFSVTGSKGAADFVIMDGSIYLGSILYCALELYLFAEGGDNAAAGQVLWEAGIGCLLVCAGGLLLRFPELNLLAGKIFRNG